MATASQHRPVVVIAADGSAHLERVRSHLERLLPGCRIDGMSPGEVASAVGTGVVVAIDATAMAADYGDVPAVWFPQDPHQTPPEKPATRPVAVIAYCDEAIATIAPLARRGAGIRVAIVPPFVDGEELGDPDRFRAAIDGHAEIAALIDCEFGDVAHRIHQRRPGCAFIAIEGEQVSLIDPASRRATPIEQASATDALAACRVAICVESHRVGYSDLTCAWTHWRPVVTTHADTWAAAIVDAANGGLVSETSAAEETAAFLLQHPQIGDVIGAQGNRWLAQETSNAAERWSELLLSSS